MCNVYNIITVVEYSACYYIDLSYAWYGYLSMYTITIYIKLNLPLCLSHLIKSCVNATEFVFLLYLVI